VSLLRTALSLYSATARRWVPIAQHAPRILVQAAYVAERACQDDEQQVWLTFRV
jgi:hypothetical protein